MTFLGPKPTQDPMNNGFERKKYLRKKCFRTSGTPDRKKVLDPARAGPAGPAGSPKVVKIVPLGSLTLLKRSGTLKAHGKVGSFSSQSFAQNTFSACVGAFWHVLGAGWGRDPVTGVKIPKNPKFKIFLVLRAWVNTFLRFSSILKGSAYTKKFRVWAK